MGSLLKEPLRAFTWTMNYSLNFVLIVFGIAKLSYLVSDLYHAKKRDVEEE